jgi:hypothetical protein
MFQIELTNFELFKNFMEVENETFYVNLHNEFDCVAIDFSNLDSKLVISFSANKYCKSDGMRVNLVFEDCSISSFSIKPEKTNLSFCTIDNVYRGRFLENEVLIDSLDGRFYYYIDFYGELHYELFAKKVYAEVNGV